MRSILKQIPKVELHCHIDGSLRVDTVYELMKKDNILKNDANIDDLKKQLMVNNDCKDLREYLNKFEIPINLMKNTKNIERIVYELLEDSSKENVLYSELRFCPLLHKTKDNSLHEIIESAIEGINRAKKDFNIESNLIMSNMRHLSFDENIKLIDAAKDYLSSNVVAIDLAGSESDFAPNLHQKLFDYGLKKGFKITVHAGETGIAKNITDSIDLLHAKRIGHGIDSIKDKEIINKLIRENIMLEVCPKSNIDTMAVKDYKDHPIKKLYDLGVKINISTDNRTVSNVTLTDEYYNLFNKLNFTKEDFYKIYQDSINLSFMNEDKKAEFLNIKDVI